MHTHPSLTKREFLKSCAAAAAVLVSGDAANAQPESSFRPPAVPLIACDPYFSIWSCSDRLNDAPTVHWTGRPHRLNSLVRIDGATYRLMGDDPKDQPALEQTSVQVLPTRSIYTFKGAGIELTLTFMTAALPEDLMLLSRPLTYVTWAVRSTDSSKHRIAVYLDASPEIAVNEPSQRVHWSDDLNGQLAILRTGCGDRDLLTPRGDDVRIDWGYLYLAAAAGEGVTQTINSRYRAWSEFRDKGSLTPANKRGGPQSIDEGAPLLALALDMGAVDSASRTAMLFYDDLFSIQYFEQNLRPYWRRSGATASDVLVDAARDYDSLSKRCEAFDKELIADATALGGPKYADICSLAYRQCLAGNKIAADTNGQPLLFPKENTSNGCIGTVDVIYPMSPQFLLFGASLSKAMLISNLQYASSSRWKFPFAPHDLGTYPQANGQVYGGGERTEENQMPVEESGNMLLLLAALAQMEQSTEFVDPYWPTLRRWADYLKAEGFDPKNQLCTDDFAGHLAHNVNLSAKAIVALGAFSQLCRMRNDKETADEYMSLAKKYAAEWVKQADGGDHFGLVFDNPQNTWSQKYNLVWDRILGLNLFPESVLRKETSFYLAHFDRFGLPLDSRKLWTKTDWTLWTATLSQNREDFGKFVDIIWKFLNGTPDRVPMSDFYWANNGFDSGMHARPVVGAMFLPFLYNKQLWSKWSSRDMTKSSNWAAFPTSAKMGAAS